MKRWHWMKIPLLLTGLAFLLRTTTLDWQSFWTDEVNAVYFINRPLRETIKMVISPEHNGPLYYLLLWIWHRLTGPSDFAVRYFSALCSVLTIPALWRLARMWFKDRVAGWTGLLFALSPFAIWYAQEAKMYALHILLATLSTLFLAKALRHNAWLHWLGYGIALNLLAYSHLFGAFAIAAHGILVLLTTTKLALTIGQSPIIAAEARWTLARSDWVRLRSYLLTILIVALPYLPVIQFALRLLPNFQLQDISKGFVPLHRMLQEYGSEYTLRTSMILVSHPWRLLGPLAALLLLGLFQAWRSNHKSALWLTGMLLLPTALFYPISFKVPAFSPKYLSAAFPFFVMTLALAIEALRHWWKPLTWAGLGLMVTLAAWANIRILTNPLYQRSDWRAAAQYLEEHVQADDIIVGFAHYATERMLQRYYHGPAGVLRFKAKPYEPEVYYEALRDAGHHALWLVLHQDQAMAPHNRLREAAGLMFPNITGIYPNDGNIAILGYSMDWRHNTLPAHATPVEAYFDNGLALVGYHADATTLPPTDNLMHPPSNWVHVTTYWQVWQDAPDTPPTAFVRLVDQQGGIWGGELQRPPTVFHFDPPSQWEPGTIVEAHYDVNLNPVTPPGTYRLTVAQEQIPGEAALLSNGETAVYLQDITITE